MNLKHKSRATGKANMGWTLLQVKVWVLMYFWTSMISVSWLVFQFFEIFFGYRSWIVNIFNENLMTARVSMKEADMYRVAGC